MTVFKGYLLLIKRNLQYLLIYTIVFSVITIIIQNSITEQEAGIFTSTKLNIALEDRDNSILSNGIKQMLEKHHVIVPLKEEVSVFKEEMFLGNIDYVITIPEHYEQGFLKGEEKIPVSKRPGEYTAVFADQQISQFLQQVKVYDTAGYQLAESVEKSLQLSDKETSVVLLDSNRNGNQKPAYGYLFQYLPFLYMSVLCLSMGIIIRCFKEKNVRRRILSSGTSANRQNLQTVLAYALIGGALWAFSMILPVAFCGKEFLDNTNVPYFLMNSFCYMVVSVGLALLIGTLSRNDMELSALANVASLGMCFLCGVYVPLSMLSQTVLQFSRFLPAYWYVTTNELLSNFVTFTKEMRNEIVRGMGIQLAFAVAFICIALVISKTKEKQENG